MIASSQTARRSSGEGNLGVALARQRGPLVAIGVFVVFFLTLQLLSHGKLNYFEISTLASGSAALALAAMGETVVVLTGGFDLSVGAVVSLVNVVLATHMGDSFESKVIWALGGVAIGTVAGIVNGACVRISAAAIDRGDAGDDVHRRRRDAAGAQGTRRPNPAPISPPC